MSSARILVVDDEPDIRELIADILDDEGYEAVLAADGAAAREARTRDNPDLILLDVWMPDIDGISLLREWREAGNLDCPVVMISGHGSVEAAVEATRLGAFDFIEKPLSMARMLVTISNALEAGQLKRENEGLRRQLPLALDPIGRSPAVQLLRERLERVAAHDANILICGEPGTGKEQLARWIHAHSRRAAGPFVVATTRSDGPGWQRLLMGESGAGGILADAQGGVLYMDDVGRLDPEAQEILLKIIDSGRIDPDSADSPELDLRVIAGACASPDRLRDNGFDEQLYYRLNVLPLEAPPLRERREDIPDLVRFYAEYFPARDGVPYRHFPVAVQNRLRQHSWPGNLRELSNLVQRLLILGGGDEITPAEVDEALAHAQSGQAGKDPDAPALFNMPLRRAREEFERQYLTYQLKAVEGSVGKLAEVVEMERTHLYRKLRQLGIEPKQVIQGTSD